MKRSCRLSFQDYLNNIKIVRGIGWFPINTIKRASDRQMKEKFYFFINFFVVFLCNFAKLDFKNGEDELGVEALNNYETREPIEDFS